MRLWLIKLGIWYRRWRSIRKHSDRVVHPGDKVTLQDKEWVVTKIKDDNTVIVGRSTKDDKKEGKSNDGN